MSKRQSIWQFVSQHRLVRIVAGPVVVLAALSLMFLGSGFFTNVSSVSAASCMNATSDTMAANSKFIYVDQNICVPAITAPVQHTPMIVKKVQRTLVSETRLPTHRHFSADVIKGPYNNFPYGQCTWWANERYHQLTGVYVPWMTNSNANVWVTRANQYHWKVSTQPKVGSIMMLASGVEGAGGYGHVGVVEKLLGGGRFQISQMNWTGVGIKSYGNFTTGRGVYFISIN